MAAHLFSVKRILARRMAAHSHSSKSRTADRLLEFIGNIEHLEAALVAGKLGMFMDILVTRNISVADIRACIVKTKSDTDSGEVTALRISLAHTWNVFLHRAYSVPVGIAAEESTNQ